MKDWYFHSFAHYLIDIEVYLRAFCTDRPQAAPLYWEMIDHHFGWNEGVVSSADPTTLRYLNGKRTRPLMTLLVAEAVSGSYAHAIPAAAGIEIIHNFTLIHDDVMDVSLERRHRPTVWSIWGIGQAINTGDGLFAFGMSALLELGQRGVDPAKIVEAMRVLLDACSATVEGQILDMSFEQRTDVTPDEYIVMIEHKTGTLIEASARLGALLSTDDRAVIDGYGDYARNLGIAFQMQDDYLGIWGDEAQTGKSASSDIVGKKKSYPVLIAFASADAEARAALDRIYAQEHLDDADVAAVKAILDTVDAAAQTRSLIERYYCDSIAALDSVSGGDSSGTLLRQIADFLIRRVY
jgi:geranylgeranyl diphosphate synthase type I